LNTRVPLSQGIQTIERGGLILDAIKNSESSVTLTALSKEVNMSKNNLKKYLVSFVKIGFLSFDEEGKTYKLGSKLIDLGLNALKELNLYSFIDTYITKIKDQLNKPIALAIWADTGPIISKYQKSNNPININIEIGYSPPMLLSSVGKCFAAFLPPSSTKEVKDKEIEKYNLDKNQVEYEMSAIEKSGYSYRNQEYDYIPGNCSISAPIFNNVGEIVAAVCVLGFMEDLGTDSESNDVQVLKEVTKEISFNLAYKTNE